MVASNSAVAPLGVHYSKVDEFYLRPFFGLTGSANQVKPVYI